MKLSPLFVLLLAPLLFLGCSSSIQEKPETKTPTSPASEARDTTFYRGADLSYVNEMLDCGASYKDKDGAEKNPYTMFEEAGSDLVRLRLWHQPGWTDYSDLRDVKRALEALKGKGMKVLLDFHYSDDWADPGRQEVPKAWEAVVDQKEALGDSLYAYTYRVLKTLHREDLLPEMVQVGNEINADILQDPNQNYGPIDWERNAFLINKGLKAVSQLAEDLGAEIEVMLHIAQPENALWWFEEAEANGISDYDWIGISYYPQWSDYGLDQLPTAIRTLIERHEKKIMVVETAYPFTLENQDEANNIMGNEALIPGFPPTQEGQLAYLKTLEEKIKEGGGQGLVYWEAAWVSTPCTTRWGKGSHWDNATLFDAESRAHLGMTYYTGE